MFTFPFWRRLLTQLTALSLSASGAALILASATPYVHLDQLFETNYGFLFLHMLVLALVLILISTRAPHALVLSTVLLAAGVLLLSFDEPISQPRPATRSVATVR